MSTLKVDSIANNGSAVDLTNGAFQIGGNDVVQGYTESASEPSSPTKGDIWWDTANEVLYQYLNGEFKEITTVDTSWSVDVSNLSYDNVSFSISAQDASAREIRFNNDGTKMFLGGTNDRIYQYSLSSAFDISTLSYDNVNWNPDGITDTQTFFFNDDGTKIYIGVSVVSEFSLSSAFDMSSTFTLLSNSLDLGEPSFCWGISRDGTKIFACPYSNQTVHSWTLSTPYDTSTATKDAATFTDSNNLLGFPTHINFDSKGTKMYIVDDSADVYQYSMTTAYDLSTASYDSKTFDFSAQSISTQSMVFNLDGTKAIVLAKGNDFVYQYSTGL